MVDQSVGRLFEMGDPDAMAEAIMAELADSEEMLSKGETGRRRVLEGFTFESNAARFEAIYERAQ
jgi:glycosyltransferase involved in cell wall biosynthesis